MFINCSSIDCYFSSNLIALILWLIAGIMLFARRPNNKTKNSNHGESFNNNDKQHNINSNNNTFDEETQQRKRKKMTIHTFISSSYSKV